MSVLPRSDAAARNSLRALLEAVFAEGVRAEELAGLPVRRASSLPAASRAHECARILKSEAEADFLVRQALCRQIAGKCAASVVE